MTARNTAKGREAENAVAELMRSCGMPHAERRTKRGGTITLPSGEVVPADAGDITGVPGVVVQVKWSPYDTLAHDLQRTDQQRQAGRAAIGLLVRKRKGVGLGRVAEWDAYLPLPQLVQLLGGHPHAHQLVTGHQHLATSSWHTDARTALLLITAGGYGHLSLAG